MEDPLTPEWRAKVDAAAAIVIQEMRDGSDLIPEQPSRSPPPNHSTMKLTAKQDNVLWRIRRGQKQKDIAAEWGVHATNISGIVKLLRIHGHLPMKTRRCK